MREDVRLLLFMNNEEEVEETVKVLKRVDKRIVYSSAHHLADFCALIKKGIWDIIIFDSHVKGILQEQILSEIKKASLSAPVIAIVEEEDIIQALQLANRGCLNYVLKGDCNQLLKVAQNELKLMEVKQMCNYACEDLLAIMSSIADGVISTDNEGRIVFINSSAQALTGWDKYAAVGQPLNIVFKLINSKTREKIDCFFAVTKDEGGKTSLRNTPILITRTGIERFVSFKAMPIKAKGGKVSGSVITFQDFEHYRQICEQLSIERNNLRIQFQYAPIGMAVVDNRFVIQNANDCFIDVCGSTYEKIIGKNLCKVLGCIDSSCHLYNKKKSCSQCLIKKCIMQVIESGIPLRDVEKTYNLTRGNKTVFRIFSCNIVPLSIGSKVNVLISFYDMTEQRIMEEKLRDSRDFYLTLFEEFPVMIWRTDLARKIDYVNKKVLEFTGREMSRELGVGWIDNIHPEDNMDYVKSYDSAFDKKEIFKHEYRIKRFDGEYRWLMSYACPYYDLDKNFAGYIGTSYDITESKQLEFEMKRAMEATKEAYRVKSEFLANMSHEIRTPLNGILGMIDLTLRTVLTEEQRDNLNIAKNCANSLIKIINDVLDFSKIEVGKFSIENVEFDIRGLVEKIMRVHHIRASEKGIELNHQIPADLPDFLIGDPNRLQQVLNNLLSNAIKFTDKGFASLVIKTMERTENFVRLQFSMVDTGIGISDDEMKRLFKSFSQVDGSRTRKHGGTGLGLVISRRIIEMMGGTLKVESEKGQGSVFSFELKFDIVKVNRCVIETAGEEIGDIIKDARILLVEDDEVNQKVIGRMLKKMGFIYDVADCGKDALNLLEQNNYDVCLMDIQMPGLDGVQTTAIIRENEVNKGKPYMPIVAVTAYALQGDRERFLAMGMDEYIAKPFQIPELYILLRKLLTGKKEASGDKSTAVGRISNYLQNYSQNIQPTINSIKNSIKELEFAVEDHNMEEIEGKAHEVKVLASLISADKLKMLAFRIELAARRGNKAEVDGLCKELERSFKKYSASTN